MVCIRFFAYPSKSPVVSCRVPSSIKLRDLRGTVISKLSTTNDGQIMKNFSRWFWELESVGSDTKFVEITNEDALLDTLGDGEVTEIFLEALAEPPPTEKLFAMMGIKTPASGSHNGVGSVGIKREREENIDCWIDSSLLPLMEFPKVELARMSLDAIKKVAEVAARADESDKKVSEMALASAASIKTISSALQRADDLERQLNELKAAYSVAQKKLIESAPASLLMEHSDEPLMALWLILNDARLEGPNAAMAVINDPRCGLKTRENRELKDIYRCPRGRPLKQASPLNMAVLANRLDVVKAIIRIIRSLNKDVVEALNEHSVLFPAARCGHDGLLKYLLSLGADPEGGASSNTPLHVAAENGETKSVRILLAANVNVNAGDGDKWTPLHFAASYNKLEVARVLLDAGCNPSKRCNEGWTALQYARRDQASDELIALLMERARSEEQSEQDDEDYGSGEEGEDDYNQHADYDNESEEHYSNNSNSDSDSDDSYY